MRGERKGWLMLELVGSGGGVVSEFEAFPGHNEAPAPATGAWLRPPTPRGTRRARLCRSRAQRGSTAPGRAPGRAVPPIGAKQTTTVPRGAVVEARHLRPAPQQKLRTCANWRRIAAARLAEADRSLGQRHNRSGTVLGPSPAPPSPPRNSAASTPRPGREGRPLGARGGVTWARNRVASVGGTATRAVRVKLTHAAPAPSSPLPLIGEP